MKPTRIQMITSRITSCWTLTNGVATKMNQIEVTYDAVDNSNLTTRIDHLLNPGELIVNGAIDENGLIIYLLNRDIIV